MTFLASISATHALTGWELVPSILERIQAPTFPNRDFNLVEFQGIGDGKTDSRRVFQDAINACAAAGGGRVVVPRGTYLCKGPISLKSHVNLHLEEGSTILFGGDPEDYLVGDSDHGGGVLVSWEGTPCYSYSPLIYAYQQVNIAVTGKGTIDGQSGKEWSAWLKKQGAAQQKIRAMNHAGTPIGQRIFGKGSFLRPSLFEPHECTGVLFEGVTVKNSPFWTLHPTRCSNVTIRGVTVVSDTWNDDGCDPESCTDVLIENCTFATRDDNIAIKAGRDNDGWSQNGGRPCENIIIRNCHFAKGSPGGVSIGSEMSGGVRNVFVENCTMTEVERPFYFKANPERGGVVENIYVRGISVQKCAFLLNIDMSYKGVVTGFHAPVFRNIQIENLICDQAETAFAFSGLPDHPIQNISIHNVSINSCKFPSSITHTEGIQINGVKANDQPLTAPRPKPAEIKAN